MFLLRLLPLFIFVFCVHPAFASSQDLFFYSSQNNELCSKHKSKAIPSFFNKCFDSNGDYKVVSFLNAEQVRARVIDAPENNTSISGFHIERPFLIIDGIHLSTEEKRSLEDFEKIVLVSGDGDYKMLVDFLIEENRFAMLLFPNEKFASSLYKKIKSDHKTFLEDVDVKKKIS